MRSDQLEACPGCGGHFPIYEGSTHAYLIASPACWQSYGEVLAREYQHPSLFAACHRLSVDAYALQHAGDLKDRRQVRSTWLHLTSLHAVFARGFSHAAATRLLARLDISEAPPLTSQTGTAVLTVADVLAAGLSNHAATAVSWARAAYMQWAEHHHDADWLLARNIAAN